MRVEQGEMVLRADKVVAEAPKAKLVRVTASGDVVITSRDATATAPLAVYDITARTIRLTGTVVLTQGGNTLRGTELLVDLKAGTATLSAKGSASGRVDGVLDPERPRASRPGPARTEEPEAHFRRKTGFTQVQHSLLARPTEWPTWRR